VRNIPRGWNDQAAKVSRISEANARVAAGHNACCKKPGRGFMGVRAFFHRHYSARVGESPAGHAIAILVGMAMMAAGLTLVLKVVFLPVGTVIGLLGAFFFAEGVFAHIKRPLRFRDFVDAVVGLSGAAIALTFALAVVFFLVTFGAGTFAAIFEWLR
jgi:hypothetical protein